MSEALRSAVTSVADALEALARELKRPRPADMTPEETDELIAARIKLLAARLRAALVRDEAQSGGVHSE
jgi:hypothetical protein